MGIYCTADIAKSHLHGDKAQRLRLGGHHKDVRRGVCCAQVLPLQHALQQMRGFQKSGVQVFRCAGAGCIAQAHALRDGEPAVSCPDCSKETVP